jgi:anhydro-N-acetylmuramic acid kinase
MDDNLYMHDDLYIGVMSGTSMDGIDTVLSSISENRITTLHTHSEDIPESLKYKLHSLSLPGNNEIDRLGETSIELAAVIANAVNSLNKKADIKPEQIRAIGSHGQTIRHRPNLARPFSLQIGDPSTIAHLTGITTITDFRMADIAAKGQGAPLVPAFHQAIFSGNDTQIILNLGGIANITRLAPKQETIGYDTGPANTLMDQWIKKHKQLDFDNNGEWASQGTTSSQLLKELLQDPYILQQAPKSTGREYFNLAWLQEYLDQTNNLSPEDIQRTLLEYTAISISNEINDLANEAIDIYLCGGGANNTLLIERLQTHMPKHNIKLTDELGVHTQHVEATAFAWLAYRTLNGLSGNLSSATGAKKSKILGGIYPAS